VPSDYRIGTEDVLGILFWREMEMSGDVTVRPDGVITLPLLGDVRAVGLSTDQLKDYLQKSAARFLSDANVTVVVRQINSRKIYVTGQVGQSGAYPLVGPRTVLQALALAGGVSEYAKVEDIQIIRNQGDRAITFKFNYKDVLRGRRLEQNILLQPGDTVLVP
jgi:polysaccharide export outer membrane protein